MEGGQGNNDSAVILQGLPESSLSSSDRPSHNQTVQAQSPFSIRESPAAPPDSTVHPKSAGDRPPERD
ncbi:MAG: hypothetical protein AAF268_16405, partial [Cyanobacteria bacterium P01_A01_bin.3]